MNAPNVPDFGPAEESISWAESDIDDLKTLFGKHFAEHNVSVIEELNEWPGMVITKMKISDEVPMLEIKRRAVSALLNTRNSFDQAVNLAGIYLTGKRFSKNFPWASTKVDLEHWRLKNFPEELRTAIKLQEPYPRSDSYVGGNDLIRALARLSNDKHSVGFSVNILGGIDFSGAISFAGNGYLRGFATFPPNWDPVKQEVDIFAISTDGVRPQLDQNARLCFNICFEVSELPNPPEVLFALNEFLAASKHNLKLVKAACGHLG